MKPEPDRRGQRRLRDDAARKTEPKRTIHHSAAAATSAANAEIQIAGELKSLGISAGWAVINTHGLGWARALALLLYWKRRYQPSVRKLGRFFVGNPGKVVWETGYKPRKLAKMDDQQWMKLLRRFK